MDAFILEVSLPWYIFWQYDWFFTFSLRQMTFILLFIYYIVSQITFLENLKTHFLLRNYLSEISWWIWNLKIFFCSNVILYFIIFLWKSRTSLTHCSFFSFKNLEKKLSNILLANLNCKECQKLVCYTSYLHFAKCTQSTEEVTRGVL